MSVSVQHNSDAFSGAATANLGPIRILLVEDSDDDARLMIYQLQKSGYEVTYRRVTDAEGLQACLQEESWDIILCDYNLPRFNAHQALDILNGSGLDTPCIIVSSAIGEETAVALMKAGAQDYVYKSNYARLIPAIAREIKEAESRKSRRQAEADLKTKEYQYRAIVETASEGIWVLNDQEETTFVNEQTAQLLGEKAELLLGKNFYHYIGAEMQAQVRQCIEKQCDGGKDSIDVRLSCQGDRERWVLMTANTFVNPDGQPGGKIVMLTDITQRKQIEGALSESETKFRLMAESAPIMIWMADADGTISYCNQMGLSFFGKSLNELQAMGWEGVIHPTDISYCMQVMNQALTGHDTFGLEFQAINAVGEYRYLTLRAKPRFSQEGMFIGFIGTCLDMTTRKQAERAIFDAYSELECKVAERTYELSKLNEALKEQEGLRRLLVSTLTHDLKTPLVAQKRLIEIFQRRLTDPEHEEILKLTAGLMESNDSMRELVGMMLDVYYYEDGKVSLELEWADLYQLVEVVIQQVAALAEKKQVRLDNAVPPTMPTLRIDPFQMRRVIQNLVGNALEKLKPGHMVRISAEAGENNVMLYVEDDGPGIPPDLLPGLFDTYFMQTKAPQKIGTGLGLHICKMIVELHGGNISVTNRDEGGAHFAITLPNPAVKAKEGAHDE